MNIITFILMGYDKHEAKINQWRVSEKALFMFAIFGGSIGGLIGMYVFHHKTKKWYFKYYEILSKNYPNINRKIHYSSIFSNLNLNKKKEY